MSSPRAPDEQDESKRDEEIEEQTSCSVSESKPEEKKPVDQKRCLSPDSELVKPAKLAKKSDEPEASSVS